MKSVKYVMILGFVFLLGCENKQLVQCQSDLELSQQELATARQDNANEKAISEQMVSKLMKEHQEKVQALQKAVEQARLDEKKKHATALKSSYTKQKELTQTILKLQGTIKQLNDEKAALESQLAEAQMQLVEKASKVDNSADMLQALAEENRKLKAENTKLKGANEE